MLTLTPDGAQVLVHVEAGTDFAGIRLLRQAEAAEADRLSGVATHELRLRPRSDLAAGWRIRAAGKLHRVLSVAEEIGRRPQLICLTEVEEET